MCGGVAAPGGTPPHILMIPLKSAKVKKLKVRKQVKAYVEQILEKWGVENVFYGTGNPDEPRLTNSCELPFCWEQNNNGSKKI